MADIMMEWASRLEQLAMASIVWLVILSPIPLRILRIRKSAFDFQWFRATIGLLLIAALFGFAATHWHAAPDGPALLTISFTEVADARIFGVALVILGLACATTSILELSRVRLSFVARATVVGADLFVLGAFLGISVATSGWTESSLAKLYWTIGPVALLLAFLARMAFSKRNRGESRPETGPAIPSLQR